MKPRTISVTQLGRSLTLVAFLCFLLSWCAPDLEAQSTVTWIPLTTTGVPPSTRQDNSVVYDPVSNRLIVFGGCNFGAFCNNFGTNFFNDVWALTNANGIGDSPAWIQLFPGGGPPMARFVHSAAYDSTTNQMIIWGGDAYCHSCPLPGDAWVLRNANGLDNATGQPVTPQWVQIASNLIQSEGSTSVYDRVSDRLIVFGGWPVLHDSPYLPCGATNDVWVLTNATVSDGSAQLISLAPTSTSGSLPVPRTSHSAAYDVATNRMIIVGGNTCLGDSADVWVLTNANGLERTTGAPATPVWIPLTTSGGPPPARSSHAASYDSVANRLIIFGGDTSSGPGVLQDIWVLTNANGAGSVPSTWIPVSASATAPPARILYHNWNLFDSASDRMTILWGKDGSNNFLNDAWVLPIGSIGAAGIPGPPPPPPGIGVPSQSNLQAQASEPVSTGTGDYFYQHTDLLIAGRGLPLIFQRSYNTLDNYAGVLGANWSHNYNVILTADGNGTVHIRWGDGHGETFTPSGTSYVPQAGVFSVLAKNADGTFTLIQKNQSRYNFSSIGKLTTIQDKNGNTVSLSYDGSGNLSQVADAVGRKLAFTYDGTNRVTQVADPVGRTVSFQYDGSDNLTQVIDPAGRNTSFAYDSNHRVSSITLPTGASLLQNTYDSAGRVVSQTNGRGFMWMFAYDTPNPHQTTITDARGNKAIHSYDSSLRILQIADAAGGTVSYVYDADNNRTSVTNQNGKTSNFAYNARGNVTSITDPLANKASFTYDAVNDLITATNFKGKTTTFTYDSNGNPTRIQDALSNATTLAYDNFGELSSKTDARGNSTSFTFDSSGNLTRITDALSRQTALAYDGIGRLTSLTDANGHTASAAYDPLSRLTSVIDPLGHQTKFAYDPIGNLQKITDANGHATSYAYDATNNLTTVTDALGHVTTYNYDNNNNRISFKNAKGSTTSYVFDVLNRLTTVTDPLSFATSYVYDAVGDVASTKDGKGQLNRFNYDDLNRLTAILYADGKGVAYSYDANGNRTTMLDAHGTTAYAYDALDRLTSVTHPGGKAVAYAYDAVGNRNRLTYPDGKVVNYAYDVTNRLSQVTDFLAHATNYSYDPASNLIRTAYPNGANIAFSYDAANRLTSVVNSAVGGSPLLNLAYTLDPIGNRTALSANGIVTQFGYDALNELSSAQLGSLKTTWTYDAVGNRLQQTLPVVGTTTYIYDAADRLLRAGTATFTYDADGNQTSVARTATAQPILYQYDAANRLISATGGLIRSTFAYDGDGNRFSQGTGSGTYQYVNDVATALPVVLNEQGPDGNISYAYGLGLIEEFSSTFNYFYHYDGLGSVIALTNAAGKPQAAYAYDPWGNALLTIPNSIGTKNKFRFTGEALDPGTGLYYLRARYYDSSLPRFVNPDPNRGSVLDPPSLNRYTYAHSNPLRFTDPSGLTILDTLCGWFDVCVSLRDTNQKNQAYWNCIAHFEQSTNGCDETALNQSQAKSAIETVKTGTNIVVGLEFGPAAYGLPDPAPWWATAGKFLWDLLAPKTAQAAQKEPVGPQPTSMGVITVVSNAGGSYIIPVCLSDQCK